MCTRWQSLPESGGIYEQDYRTLSRMAVCLNVERAIYSWRQNTGDKIHNISVYDRETLRMLMDNGINING